MATRIAVQVAQEAADADSLDELAGLLRQELLALDVDDVQRARAGQAPAGTRGVDVESIGALVVTLQGSVGLLDVLVRTVRSWLNRGPSGRSVELTVGNTTLRLGSATAEQQERLVDEFVRAAARS